MVYFKTKTLFYVSSAGAAAIMGMGMYFMRRMKNIYRDSAFFQDAMHILESHPEAQQLLGTPITSKFVDLVPPDANKEPTSIAEFTAYVKGPKMSALMRFWAERKQTEADGVKIDITKIDLEPGGDRTKRISVKS